MYSDLKNYVPKDVEFVVSESVKEMFPPLLDFNGLGDFKNVSDVIKFIGEHFVATFPSNETAMRMLDAFEIGNIREEYCVLQENEVPKRKLELEQTLEEIKYMKKKAEQAYESILEEVAKYAAEVKNGTREILLPAKETFCIALAGHYLIYTYNREKGAFLLAKAFEIPDSSELWASDDANREAMLDLFGVELPSVEGTQEA